MLPKNFSFIWENRKTYCMIKDGVWMCRDEFYDINKDQSPWMEDEIQKYIDRGDITNIRPISTKFSEHKARLLHDPA